MAEKPQKIGKEAFYIKKDWLNKEMEEFKKAWEY